MPFCFCVRWPEPLSFTNTKFAFTKNIDAFFKSACLPDKLNPNDIEMCFTIGNMKSFLTRNSGLPVDWLTS